MRRSLAEHGEDLDALGRRELVHAPHDMNFHEDRSKRELVHELSRERDLPFADPTEPPLHVCDAPGQGEVLRGVDEVDRGRERNWLQGPSQPGRHLRPDRVLVRARRGLALAQRLQPGEGQARPGAGSLRPAPGEEHQRGGRDLPGGAGWGGGTSGRRLGEVDRPGRPLVPAGHGCRVRRGPRCRRAGGSGRRAAFRQRPTWYRRPAVRQSGRGRGHRPARGRDHRGHHHRPRPLPRPGRDRAQLDRGLQGQGGRRAAGRQGAGRWLRSGRLDPAAGRAGPGHGPAHRRRARPRMSGPSAGIGRRRTCSRCRRRWPSGSRRRWAAT